VTSLLSLAHYQKTAKTQLVAQALRIARGIGFSCDKAEALARIAACLSSPEREEVLVESLSAIAKGYPSPEQVPVFYMLGPILPKEFVPQLFELTQRLLNPYRNQAQVVLGTLLPSSDAQAVLEESFEGAMEVNPNEFLRLIEKYGEPGRGKLLRAKFEQVRNDLHWLDEGWLCRLFELLQPQEREHVIDVILEHRHGVNAFSWISRLALLADYFGGPSRERILQTALEAVQGINDGALSKLVILTLASFTSNMEACERIQAVVVQSEAVCQKGGFVGIRDVARTLSVLGVHQSTEIRGEIMKLALESIPKSTSLSRDLYNVFGFLHPDMREMPNIQSSFDGELVIGGHLRLSVCEFEKKLNDGQEADRAKAADALLSALLDASPALFDSNAAVGLASLGRGVSTLSLGRLHGVWTRALLIVSARPREEALCLLVTLYPVVQKLGGREVSALLQSVIREVCAWWP
jgi:hypothetical protein